MKKSLTLIGICGLLLSSYLIKAQTKFESLNFIYSIQGKQILSGQHNDQKNLDCFGGGGTNASYWTEQVHSITGKYPALYSGDMLFNDDVNARWEITYEAEKQWNAGAVVQMMWHSCPPTVGASCGWNPGIISSLSAQQFTELLTDGSALNKNWKARVDEVAIHLAYLKSKGVEVFWRPYHEQNQTVFWWNSQGAGNTKALWRMMHDYMTNVKGLDNLVWIWDVQDIGGATNYWDWNPGNQYWDILALDIYADAYYNSEYYNNMLTAAGGKPIAIGECFNLPSSVAIDRFPEYTFFMNWSYGLKKGLSCENTNSDAFIQEVYNNPKVITRDEMPGWGKSKVPNNLASKKQVTVSSTEVGANVASNITDGNYTTRWSSLYTDTQWMYIDLLDQYNINQIKITWEAAMAKNYYIETSNDAVTWTNLRTVVNNTTLTNDFTGLNVTARYVRIYGTARATIYGYSIYELEVYGIAIPKPYSGTAISIPGTIEAENYDLGGEGVAYHDLTPSNSHGQYRTDAVDIEACTDAGAGFNIGDSQAGEWTAYSVNVSNTGIYDLNVRVAATSAGKTMSVEMDDVNISGTIAVPNTGGWQAWQTVTIKNISLSAGTKLMKVNMGSDLINLNYVSITKPVITSFAYDDLYYSLNIYPNPSHGLINFTLPSAMVLDNKIEVINTMGTVIYQQVNAPSNGNIDLEILGAGQYFLKITSPVGVIIKPILIIPFG